MSLRTITAATCIALSLLAGASVAQGAAVAGALTAPRAKAVAEDRILAKVGIDGTLDSLTCTRTTARSFSCRGAGTMFMSGGEHGYTATAAVKNVRVKGRWRTTSTVRIVHDTSSSSGSTDDGGHHH